MPKILIVAYQTAGGKPLRKAIEQVAGQEPDTEFVLLVPATHTQHLLVWTEGESRAVAEERAERAAAGLAAVGVRLADVRVGHADPLVAVSEELAEQHGYDGIIVSTFPPGISRWLGLDLPSRLEREFDLPVTHVVVEP